MAALADADGAAGKQGQDKEEAGEAAEKEAGAPMTLQDIEACNIQEMAKDKFKSRLLQRSLLRGPPEVVEMIFKKAEPYFMELVRDQYGNYLSQKILEVASTPNFDQLFLLLKGNFKELAQDVHGTRAVQKVVEQAISRGKVPELMEALPGDLIESLARSVTGFHVVVKLLEALPSKEVEGILDLLCGSAEKALILGMDQWGCCVLKKCVDRAEGETRERIVDAITDNTLALVKDQFGNYVVQHLLLSGPNPTVTKIIDGLKGRMFDFALQKFSSNVLEKCLLNSTDKDRNKIINEILNPSTVLPSEAVRMLLFHQYGNYVFQQALEVAKDPQFSLLVEHAKQRVQDVVKAQQQGSEPSSAPENLSSEHAKRLAMKLVKKYPQLSEGLEMETGNMASTGGDQSGWGSGYYDPYVGAYGGYDPYGAPWANPMQMPGSPVYGGYPFPAWDPSFGGACQPFGFPAAAKGQGQKGGRGGSRQRSQGRRGGQRPGDGRQKGKQAGGTPVAAAGKGEAVDPSGDDNQTVRVGRIVGFWPNYTVTYDEVPVGGASGGGGRGGGRGRGKARGKASAKKPAAPVAPTPTAEG